MKPAGWRVQRGLVEGRARDCGLKVPQMLWAGSRYPGGCGGGSPSPRWHLTGTGPRRGCDEPGCLRGWVAAAGRGVPTPVAPPHREHHVRRGSRRTISQPFLEAEDSIPNPLWGTSPGFPKLPPAPHAASTGPHDPPSAAHEKGSKAETSVGGAGLEDAGRLPAVECVLGRASGRPPPGAVRVRAVVSGVQAWCEPGSLQLKLCINPL